MGQVKGAWVPETDEEAQLLTGLHQVTATAYNDGVDQADIVAAMNALAAHIGTYDEDGDIGIVELEDPEPPKTVSCPACSSTIDAVKTMMGGGIVVVPCGCTPDPSDIVGWVDEPGGAE